MNYPVQRFTVTTEDNYVLGLHRIPQPRPTDKVVLIQHGMLSSSGDWVLIGPKKSLAFWLHDSGYDVWLGNARGNQYSRTHLNLTTDQKSYWNFSWHEMGLFDLPATIDKILETTKVKKMDYIGHSQGLTTFLCLTSLRPEYQKFFRTVIGFSPIAFLSHIHNSALRILSSNVERLESVLDRLKIYEITPSNGLRASLAKILCSEKSFTQDFCANLLFVAVGPGPVYLNKVKKSFEYNQNNQVFNYFSDYSSPPVS